jgi:hypothetical protein
MRRPVKLPGPDGRCKQIDIGKLCAGVVQNLIDQLDQVAPNVTR